MRPDTINLNIEEHYTPEEKAEIAVKLAQQIADREQVKLDKQASDAAFNERLKKADAEISELAKRYNKGCETAVIGCAIRYNIPEPGKKSYFRMDTEELIETHEMNWGEKQEELQLNLTEQSPEATPETPSLRSAKIERVDLRRCSRRDREASRTPFDPQLSRHWPRHAASFEDGHLAPHRASKALYEARKERESTSGVGEQLLRSKKGEMRNGKGKSLRYFGDGWA